ncbi:MAG: FAD-binding oxidoreductase [Chloroflexi bacterium]|nr:FAD-binding oxidoreductase [Chloroflexota bacterium]
MTSQSIPQYDVIVIGAGSIGAPAALYLAEAGYKVLVLDGAASAGQQSNKRAIGGVRATHSDPAKIRLCLRSIEIFRTWQETRGEDIEWVTGGYSFVAYREQEEKTLKTLLAVQKSLGLNIDWYDGDSLLKIAPGLNPANLRGGTFSPEDGNCSPLLALHAFYTHACRAGADFRFNEPVTGLVIEGGRIKGVCTCQGRYAADVVINAAGAWAREIGLMAGLDLPVNPDCHEAGITEPVAPFLSPMIVDIRPAPGSANFYFYQHKTGQIIFCITPNPPIWGFDVDETSVFLPQVAKRMIEVMPRLQNIRVRRTWRGLYPMTPDGNPIVGWSKEVQGLLNAVGMCGQGFMLGPGTGELLARMVSNNLTSEDCEVLEILSPYRKSKGMEVLK